MGARDSSVARELLYDDQADRCNLVELAAKAIFKEYMNTLKFMVFGAFEKLLFALQFKAQVKKGGKAKSG